MRRYLVPTVTMSARRKLALRVRAKIERSKFVLTRNQSRQLSVGALLRSWLVGSRHYICAKCVDDVAAVSTIAGRLEQLALIQALALPLRLAVPCSYRHCYHVAATEAARLILAQVSDMRRQQCRCSGGELRAQFSARSAQCSPFTRRPKWRHRSRT